MTINANTTRNTDMFGSYGAPPKPTVPTPDNPVIFTPYATPKTAQANTIPDYSDIKNMNKTDIEDYILNTQIKLRR